jgi:hypothetical protein
MVPYGGISKKLVAVTTSYFIFKVIIHQIGLTDFQKCSNIWVMSNVYLTTYFFEHVHVSIRFYSAFKLPF